MKELTIKIDDLINQEIEEYLLTVKGIIKVNIDNETDSINLKYNPDLISIKIIKQEIILFLNIKNSSIISFNKHPNNEVEKREIIIKDLCCEYCLKGMIEELLEINGIEKAITNFDYHKKDNVIITINYDNNLITNEEISELELDFNSL